MTLTLPQGTHSSVAPLLAEILYKAFHYRNHMLWNIWEMYTLYAGGVAMLLYINELIIEPLVSEN